jgi:hypothetical protein
MLHHAVLAVSRLSCRYETWKEPLRGSHPHPVHLHPPIVGIDAGNFSSVLPTVLHVLHSWDRVNHSFLLPADTIMSFVRRIANDGKTYNTPCTKTRELRNHMNIELEKLSQSQYGNGNFETL